MSNPNTNNLEDMACPKCKSHGPFTICAEIFVTVTDNSVEDYGDTDWEPESYCRCQACDHSATVDDFIEEN